MKTASKMLEKIRLKKIAKLVKGKRVLDIGCGNANLIKFLPKHVDYTGIDFDGKVIETNKRKWKNAKFYNIELEKEASISEKNYESAVISAALQYISMRSAVGLLKSLKTKLTREGRVIITAPTVMGERMKMLLRWTGLLVMDLDKYKQHFSKRHLTKLIEEAGFRIINYRKFELGLNQIVVAAKIRNI